MSKAGDMIRERRKAMGFSSQDLGVRVGVDSSTITRYETGEIDIKQIPCDKAMRLSNALGIPIDKLMGWTDYVPPEPEVFERLCVAMRDLAVILPDGSVDFKRLNEVLVGMKALDEFCRITHKQ